MLKSENLVQIDYLQVEQRTSGKGAGTGWTLSSKNLFSVKNIRWVAKDTGTAQAMEKARSLSVLIG